VPFAKGPYQPEPAKKKCHPTKGSDNIQPFCIGDRHDIEASGKEDDPDEKSPPCEKKGCFFEKMVQDSHQE